MRLPCRVSQTLAQRWLRYSMRRSLKVGIANKRLAVAWNKDYLYRLIDLEPKPV